MKDDTISRAAVRLIQSAGNAYPEEWNQDYERGFEDAINAVLALPSAQPVAKDINVPVKDCISRQAVLALPRSITRNMRGEVVEETIDVAAIKALPSAQPSVSKTEIVEDTISRKAALNALAYYIHNMDKALGTGRLSADDCMDAAESVLGEDALPSAQPEIIRCKDCRWGKEVCGNIECFADINVPPEYHGYDWFCPNGERRTDG